MTDLVQKTRDDYNKIAKLFASTRHEAGELQKFKPFIKNGQYILDWGCGNGKLLHVLKDADVHYFGVDQSNEILKCARAEHAKIMADKKIKFFCTAHKEKKFPAAYFDVVFMAASFHHLPTPLLRLKLLKKTYTEMKPGATIIITVWNLKSDWAKEKLKGGWTKINTHDYLIPWKDQSGKVWVERYYHHFLKSELSDLLKQAGFTVTELYYSKGNERVPQKEGRNLVAVAVKGLSS